MDIGPLSAPLAPLLSFRRHPDPRASIIIPTWRNAGLVRRCLQALRSHVGPDASHEVIVLVNGADPEVLGMLDTETEGVQVLAASVNRGFGGGCNQAAEVARGELLVLLNDDTEVEPGWLEALLETADAEPEAGAVGSLVSRPDGTIQEVGSIVWRDGSTYAVGRGLPVASHPYGFVRRVDYCSACSLLVRRSLWAATGGFDERYYPAYYEDADLCFAIRRLGKSILCQPRSRLLHHEASSTAVDYRDFLMRRNRRQFVEKWAAELAERESSPRGAPEPIAEEARVVQEIERRIAAVQVRVASVRAEDRDRLSEDFPPPPMTELASARCDRSYLERELGLRNAFLSEMQAQLSQLQSRAEERTRSETELRERVAGLEREIQERGSQLETLREILRQPRHRLAERISTVLKRNAGFLHRALKSFLS
jgi:GT2 family glycosyltransferase